MKKGILYLSSHSPGIGGGETYLFELADSFNKEFRVHFVEVGENDALAQRINELGYPLKRIKYSLSTARNTALQVKTICEEWDIDLIHLNNRRDALLAYYLPYVPKVITIHTNFFAAALGLSQNVRSLIMLVLLRFAKDSIQKYITVTRYGADRLGKYLNVSDKHIHPIYNGLNLKQVTDSTPLHSSEKTVICSIANLSRNKGLEFLIRALALLHELPWECRIVGEGADRARLKALVCEYGLQGRISFTGTLPRDQVFELLSQSRMMVLPSLYEGFPYSLLEAMSLGVPIITTRVLGLPEIIPEGKNGILVNPGDVTGLANAIRTLLTDNQLAFLMGNEGQRLVDMQFSLNQMLRQTHEVYNELLNEVGAA
ncbi:glycosyltransferase family 4 protein [Geobacter argillaceus]|uniref:Glycosyltransferase involved in cell wall biosynthesis n=1 Tax=Geobacter argillaceus TaxID=345631 RepID=A0A562W8A8_9BACT|nr:glycosyltransferase family 4 protein [Geobacter argillaceus]TWJ26355.1 glycosyltransferase involved in cell wall biosynthesis [Geobacter argillaceus]